MNQINRNRVELAGIITNVMPTRCMPSGIYMHEFWLQIEEKGYKENPDKVSIIPVIRFSKADVNKNEVGQKVIIFDGKIKSNPFTKKDGTQTYILSINASNIEVIGEDKQQSKEQYNDSSIDEDLPF